MVNQELLASTFLYISNPLRFSFFINAFLVENETTKSCLYTELLILAESDIKAGGKVAGRVAGTRVRK